MPAIPLTDQDSIRGIEPETLLWQDALGRLNGQADLLAIAARDFVAEFGGEAQRIDEGLSRGERGPVADRLHTLRGVAATLGAERLAHAAADLELAIRDCVDSTDLQERQDTLCRRLQSSVVALERLSEKLESPAVRDEGSTPPSCGLFVDEHGCSRKPRVLIVDDVDLHQQVLTLILEPDHEVMIASSGAEALKLCRRQAPDLILLDIVMPGMGGLEICRRLKQDPATSEAPIIFVTEQKSADEQVRGLSAGAVDFISKPLNPIVTRARVCTHLTLRAQADLLKTQALIDSLTGVPNRRQFDERLHLEWRAGRRNHCELTALMIDIDYFKDYNDRYGHPKGDDCLRQIAAVLQAELRRPRDFLARWGGEEFACLLPDTRSAGAHAKAHSMLAAIRRRGVPHLASSVAEVVTVSIGVATMIPSVSSRADKLLAAADEQLYRAKSAGRNRVASSLDLLGSRQKSRVRRVPIRGSSSSAERSSRRLLTA